MYMETPKLLVCYGIVLALLFTSCSIDKRLYSSGYHVDWNFGKKKPVGNVSALANKKECCNDKVESIFIDSISEPTCEDDVVACSDNSIILPKTTKERMPLISFNISSNSEKGITEFKNDKTEFHKNQYNFINRNFDYKPRKHPPRRLSLTWLMIILCVIFLSFETWMFFTAFAVGTSILERILVLLFIDVAYWLLGLLQK